MQDSSGSAAARGRGWATSFGESTSPFAHRPRLGGEVHRTPQPWPMATGTALETRVDSDRGSPGSVAVALDLCSSPTHNAGHRRAACGPFLGKLIRRRGERWAQTENPRILNEGAQRTCTDVQVGNWTDDCCALFRSVLYWCRWAKWTDWQWGMDCQFCLWGESAHNQEQGRQ